jgi:hypothetical protein
MCTSWTWWVPRTTSNFSLSSPLPLTRATCTALSSRPMSSVSQLIVTLCAGSWVMVALTWVGFGSSESAYLV